MEGKSGRSGHFIKKKSKDKKKISSDEPSSMNKVDHSMRHPKVRVQLHS